MTNNQTSATNKDINYKVLFEEHCKNSGFDIQTLRQAVKTKKLSSQEFESQVKKFIDQSYIQDELVEKIDLDNQINLKEGEVFDLEKLILSQKFTQPPSRYSAASLIKKMEELGIGRPSTYATIISTLQDRGYVDSGNSMLPTTLGMKVNDILQDNFTEVTSSQMTADMEDNLDKVSRGEMTYEQILGDFWWEFKSNVEQKKSDLTVQKDKYRSTATDLKCPTCNNEMQLKMGRFGEYFQCQLHHEHQFPKNFREYEATLLEAQEKYTNQLEGKKCEVCGKDLIIRVSKSSLKPYIACVEYRVGNKHTVTNIVIEGQEPKTKTGAKGRGGFKKGFKKTTKKVIGSRVKK